MLEHDRLFHIGIRVVDIEAAMADIGKQAGVAWATPRHKPMPVWVPGQGNTELPLIVTYSVDGPVHLELLEGPAGSVWSGHDHPGAHHFGYWSDDVAADTEELLAAGWTLEMAANSPEEGYGRYTYVRSPSGYLAEPVSINNRPRFERWWAGGSLDDPVTS